MPCTQGHALVSLAAVHKADRLPLGATSHACWLSPLPSVLCGMYRLKPDLVEAATDPNPCLRAQAWAQLMITQAAAGFSHLRHPNRACIAPRC